MNMARLQQHYREKVAPELTAKFGYTSPMQVPRLTKITSEHGCERSRGRQEGHGSTQWAT